MQQEQMTTEQFQKIRMLFESADSENHILALSILEELPFEANICIMLFATKWAALTEAVWMEHAPNVRKNVRAIKGLDVSKILTFKAIFLALTKMKADQSQFDVYMQIFSKDLLEQMHSMGHDIIESIEIKLRAK